MTDKLTLWGIEQVIADDNHEYGEQVHDVADADMDFDDAMSLATVQQSSCTKRHLKSIFRKHKDLSPSEYFNSQIDKDIDNDSAADSERSSDCDKDSKWQQKAKESQDLGAGMLNDDPVTGSWMCLCVFRKAHEHCLYTVIHRENRPVSNYLPTFDE